MIAFSQRDPRWAAQKLGTGEQTIGQAGCLLSCAAGLLASWDVGTDPGRLNAWLTNNYGYVDDNLFVFQSIEAFGVDLADLVFCDTAPAPMEKLHSYLRAGRGVIVKVDFKPGGTVQQHWVRLLEPGRIADPWQLPGQEERALDSYFVRGWDAARAIFAAVVYARVDRSVTPTRAVAQFQLCPYMS
jgi:hypothetical protein